MVEALAKKAKEASVVLRSSGVIIRNAALVKIAQAIISSSNEIISANRSDLEAARQKGLKESFIERLTLNEDRVKAMADGVLAVANLDDPIGQVISMWTRPNGLRIGQKRVPIGVIGVIFESRPNVTADAAALCIKSGNTCVLRGGSDAINSNKAIVDVMRRAVEEAGLPKDCVCLVEDTSRETAAKMMRLNGLIDVLIPRGGAGLINAVVSQASVPVIQTGAGNCHVYVDGEADMDMAVKIAVSAKVSRPSVCNSAETLLVDSAIADKFLPVCAKELICKGVELRGCERARKIVPEMKAADDEDFYTEYNALIYSVKVVDGIDEAMAHIEKYSTHHSEAIITESYLKAERFLNEVDSAAVYVNASTRFTDGGEFGFGAEIGISNQKLHVRGPIGLKELTTVKYVIYGAGQIR
ncbi:MAG: glutamate-5-semialdehyde dehydrogenase [Clostridia bacterium]|nr:glutamate-5-semialdehyde dehydrogenase [Clostridia bacterium]